MNIIWMVVDTLRADRLSCYGYFRQTSPTIDRLAAEGVLFEDCYASGISTGNAFTCLLTGLPSIRHRYYITPGQIPDLERYIHDAQDVYSIKFDDAIPTVPEIVQSNSDYTTVAVDNLVSMGGHMTQTVRGFEYYIRPVRDAGFPQPEYTAGELNASFLPWLRSHGQEKFFAFLHFWDPHHNPYRAPGYRDRFRQQPGSLEGLPLQDASAGYQYVPAWGRVEDLVWGMPYKLGSRQMDGGVGSVEGGQEEYELTQDLYDCSIAYLDSQIARILDVLGELGVLDQTLILLTADHGEGLGSHGIWGHGQLYDDTIHIPLVLWRPGTLAGGVRVKGFTQHIDVGPTLLDLMGIPGREEQTSLHLGSYDTDMSRSDDPVYRSKSIGAWLINENLVEVSMEGRSLLPQIGGQEGGPESIVTEVRRGPGDPGLRALTTGSWKLIESLAGELQLYDRESDPMEKINLAEEHPARAASMSGLLHDWVREHLHDRERDPMRIW